MKKILALSTILFLAVGVFSSCNKQNDVIHTLIGTWQLVKEETYDKDGNLTNDSSNIRTLTFTESAVAVISKYNSYTTAYIYDSDNHVIRIGASNLNVKKLTSTELVIIDDWGERGWNEMTFKKE